MQGWSARSRILTDRRAPTLRLPAKGDGCSTSEVLSTTRNRRAPGIAPTAFIGRSSFHSIHPLGRPPRFESGVRRRSRTAVGMLRRKEVPRLWYRTLSPDFDCVGRCSLPGGPSRGTDPTLVRGFPRRGRASIVRLGRPVPGRGACPRLGHKPGRARAPSDRERPQRP